MTDKKREDAWQDDHDKVLAQTVLFHIRSGGTQLAAFNETGEKLNRTSSACGFRWNSAVRKHYENEIREAKLNRTKQKQHRNEDFATISNISSFDDASPRYDEAFGQIIKIAKDQAQKFEQLLHENAKLKIEIKDLKNQKPTSETIRTTEDFGTEDIQTFIKIMNRARNLTSLNLNV